MSFDMQARQVLTHLAEILEAALPDADCDFTGDILSLTLPSGAVYVINKHAPTEQIWLASPLSGAWHFHEVNRQWLDTRQQQPLFSVLQKELGIAVP